MVLNEDFKFMPRLLDMDFNCRDWFCAISSTLFARSRELERLRPAPLTPLVVNGGDADDANRTAAARLRGDAVGEARYGTEVESPDESVDEDEMFFWCPFDVPDLPLEVVLIERASGLGC